MASGTTIISCVVGAIAALCLASRGKTGRVLLVSSGILTLALPPFLVVNSWLDALGPSINILNPAGTLLILASLYWPITTFCLWIAWRRLDPTLLECEPAARGWALIWHVLLPLGRQALCFAALLTFVMAINNFSVPSILQTKVYATEIWVRYSTGLSGGGALVASWPLLLAPAAMILLFFRRGWSWPTQRPRLEAGMLHDRLGNGWRAATGIVATLACCASIALPLAQLGTGTESWQAIARVIAAGSGATWNSVFYAVATASLCTFGGLLLAGWRATRGALGASWLLFFLPGSVLAIGLLAGTNSALSSGLRDSCLLVVMGLALRHLVLVWTATSIGYESADSRLIDAAKLDGASGWSLWRHGYWPQTWRHVLSGWYAVYILCLWEVDSLVLLAPPGGDTLAMRAFNLLHYGHTAEVNGICLLSLGLALAPLAVFGAVRGIYVARGRYAQIGAAAALCLLTSCAPANKEIHSEVESSFFRGVEVIGTRGAGIGQFTKPRSLALDRENNLYVADMTGRVQKFSPAGEFLLSWQMPQTDLGRPKGMCRDHNGNIVVIEPHYSRINHHHADGKLALQWGRHGTNQGELMFPRSAGVTTNGEILVSEYGHFERVQRFQLQTGAPPRFLNSFGSPGSEPGRFNRPEGLCVDPAGLVHVADSCNHRVQIFTLEGKLIGSYGKPGKGLGELSYPYDVRVDASGLRFVCEFGNSRIHVFDSKGAPVETIGIPGSKPGQFSNPWSIDLDSKGNLYVADSQNHRVQKLIRREAVGLQLTAIK